DFAAGDRATLCGHRAVCGRGRLHQAAPQRRGSGVAAARGGLGEPAARLEKNFGRAAGQTR
ncbi:unnamed protein product, partial [Effrenium voratum]